jgi:alpha-tubulin suppressor-like RCC1 family protein
LGGTAIALSLGTVHSCAVTGAHGLKCWGYNGYYRLGDGTLETRYTPVDVVGLTDGVASVSAGEVHTCALTLEGGVKCWGFNGHGEVGDGTNIVKFTPTDVQGLTVGVADLTIGDLHTCAALNNGQFRCWGYNNYGQLGDLTKISRNSPADVLFFL